MWVGTQGVCSEEVGWECVLFLDHAFGGHVRLFVAIYVGMCANFAQGGGVACLVSGMDEGDDGIQE